MIIDLVKVRAYLASARACEEEAENQPERTADILRRYAVMQRQRADDLVNGRRTA